MGYLECQLRVQARSARGSRNVVKQGDDGWVLKQKVGSDSAGCTQPAPISGPGLSDKTEGEETSQARISHIGSGDWSE